MSRRTLLRGVGTATALPLLDAMLPLSALAQSVSAKARPNRLAFVFVPNGMHMPDWTPTTDGPAFELPYIMEPLKNVKDQLLVMTGLTQDKARPNGDGPGDHARSAAAWLTGCQPRKTSGADIKVGISADQLAAQKVGYKTPFASLELGCERGAVAGDCDSGYSCAYSSTIAWRSESTPVAKETDPRLVFERLFSNSDPYESAESRHRRQEYKKSILDFVMDDASSLKKQLGTRDQRKLEEYFASVREIEQRVQRAEQVARQTRLAGVKEPTAAPADYREQMHLMADMMALAFQTDLTRICTFMLANEGSNRSYSLIGVPEGHHDLSHHGGAKEKQEKIRQINRFHVTQLAYLLEKLNSIKEGDATVLDNSMVVYGGGISDGDRHNHDDLPILVAGRGGGTIHTGRHITYPDNTPLNNLYLSLLDRMGIPAEHLGDSTGKLQQLF
jgi:hypothetical protein